VSQCNCEPSPKNQSNPCVPDREATRGKASANLVEQVPLHGDLHTPGFTSESRSESSQTRQAKGLGHSECAKHGEAKAVVNLTIPDMARSTWATGSCGTFARESKRRSRFLKQSFGLDRCTWKSLGSFNSYVWSSVLSFNLLVWLRRIAADQKRPLTERPHPWASRLIGIPHSTNASNPSD